MFLNRKRRTLRSLSAAAVTPAAAKSFVHPSLARRHERKAQQIEECAQIPAVTGGITSQTSLPIDRCFEAVANSLKRNGHEIRAANKDAGTILSAMEIAGKYTQTAPGITSSLLRTPTPRPQSGLPSRFRSGRNCFKQSPGATPRSTTSKLPKQPRISRKP
jgi:hypothetical protein